MPLLRGSSGGTRSNEVIGEIDFSGAFGSSNQIKHGVCGAERAFVLNFEQRKKETRRTNLPRFLIFFRYWTGNISVFLYSLKCCSIQQLSLIS